MSESDVLLMNSGGIKSLVMTALQVRTSQPRVMFVHDGRASTSHHHVCFKQQASHFSVAGRSEASLPELRCSDGVEASAAILGIQQLLLAALGEAAQRDIGRVIWPVCAGHDTDVISRVTESLVLLEHAAELETGRGVIIQAPLLDKTLKQVIELGEQLEVPWKLGRSCLASTAKPCGQCRGCRTRVAAFTAAGVEDPLPHTADGEAVSK